LYNELRAFTIFVLKKTISNDKIVGTPELSPFAAHLRAAYVLLETTWKIGMVSSASHLRNENVHILVADDSREMRDTLCDILLFEKYSVTPFDPATADPLVLQIPCDVVILDIFMPNTDGFKLREEICKYSPDAQFIVITGKPDQKLFARAMDIGAHTFLTKPFSAEQIKYSILGALRMQELLRKKREIEVDAGAQGIGLIGSSKHMADIRRKISEIAPLDIPVVVAGESGTGKEVVARCVHEFSPRAKGRFTTVNCAGLPHGLIESELFGHVQGAFTGAAKTKHGYFEVTNGGTLFLDEIGDLPLELQSRLLRVLDRGEYNRVGDTELRRTDVRIVCATNCDLTAMMEKGTFRKDLYYRLRGSQITLLPLRERKDDIPTLVRYFLSDELYSVVPDAMKALMDFDWPGNIRQLKMTVSNLKGVCISKIITLENVAGILGVCVSKNNGTEVLLPYKQFKNKVLSVAEKQYFRSLIEAASGNIARASRMAGMDRKNFYEKLKHFEIPFKKSQGDL
jgi:DNA-binding NtrC family response regulator